LLSGKILADWKIVLAVRFHYWKWLKLITLFHINNLLQFFTANFSQIIGTEFVKSSAQYKAMSVAIRGYGYFAAPCKQIAPDQLKFLLSHLLKKSAFLITS